MKERIKIFTRSFDLKLYRYSRGLFENLGIPVVRLTDQTADGYFYTMLRDTECDIAINIDEDAFITNPDAMLNLVDYVVSNGYANAGCPDGGGFCPRAGNPIVTNPFFNVFNLRLIRTKFSKSAVKDFSYVQHKEEMVSMFPKERLETKWTFDRFEYEPYYQFFLWLAFNFKTLYLPSKRHEDGTSTVLLDLEGNTICMHSWFARFYTTPDWAVRFFEPSRGMQKARIDALINQAYSIRGLEKPQFGLKDKLAFLGNKVLRWIIKVPQRISRWPHKLKVKISKKRDR